MLSPSGSKKLILKVCETIVILGHTLTFSWFLLRPALKLVSETLKKTLRKPGAMGLFSLKFKVVCFAVFLSLLWDLLQASLLKLPTPSAQAFKANPLAASVLQPLLNLAFHLQRKESLSLKCLSFELSPVVCFVIQSWSFGRFQGQIQKCTESSVICSHKIVILFIIKETKSCTNS